MATPGIRPEPPLVVIAGPTASGKTALAIRIAKEFNGEIISADSRAIYQGLSVGTAKPTVEEQQGIPHWGIDLVRPDQRFTAADFQRYARAKIMEIRSRQRIPILVGGTGLYVDAVMYEFDFPVDTHDHMERRKLEELSLEELHKYCRDNNIILPENDKNHRYVVNAILRKGRQPERRQELSPNTIVVGITTDRNELRSRIAKRAERIFGSGVIEEAIVTADRYGWDTVAMTGNVYPLIRRLQEGTISLREAQELFVIRDWQLAKRQLTWLKRNGDIQWFELPEAYTYLAHRLDTLNNS